MSMCTLLYMYVVEDLWPLMHSLTKAGLQSVLLCWKSQYQLYSTLLYSTLLYSTLLYSTLLYSTLLYSTLLYSPLLYSTLLYSTLLYFTLLYFYFRWYAKSVLIKPGSSPAHRSWSSLQCRNSVRHRGTNNNSSSNNPRGLSWRFPTWKNWDRRSSKDLRRSPTQSVSNWSSPWLKNLQTKIGPVQKSGRGVNKTCSLI